MFPLFHHFKVIRIRIFFPLQSVPRIIRALYKCSPNILVLAETVQIGIHLKALALKNTLVRIRIFARHIVVCMIARNP